MKVTMADPRDFIPYKYKKNSTTANNSSDDNAQIDSPWSDLAKPSSPMTPREHVLDSISENAAVKTEDVTPTFTSTQKTKNKNGLKNKLSAVVVVVLLLAGVAVSAFMAQEAQDVRQQASTGAGASCSTSSNAAPFNKKTCNCDGKLVYFDNTGFCADQAGEGETTGEYGSDDGSAEQGLCAVYYKYGCTDTAPPSTTPGGTNYNGCWTCGANGCSIKTGAGFEHCAAGCDVWKWSCDRIDNLSGGCQDGQPSIGNSQSFSASCGTEQIDVQCGGQPRDFRSRINDEPCDTSTPSEPPSEPPTEPPTTVPPEESFSCVNIEMLDADNMLMSDDDDKNLREGDVVRFRASSSDDNDARITFEFRILPPNTTEWVNLTMGTTTATNRNTSGPYTIISSGSHTAQSRICVSGVCQEWENLGDATTVFSDVPLSHWAYNAITTLYRSGIPASCDTNPLRFCPEQTIYRAQTATLVMRAKYGETFFSSYTLPNTATFADVPLTHAQVKYVEKMYDDDITAGCSANPLNFCPDRNTTRAEAAIMIMRTKYGANYNFTNPATSTFADVPVDAGYRKYVEQMFADGITAGCSQNPRNFCPTREVTRAEVAQMIYKAFNLDEN